MLPEEMQALMAKLLLILFATFMFCLGKVRAESLAPHACQSSIVVTMENSSHSLIN
jgi:hypothetical protein